jgi:Zn-dependent protease/predicted transcriptional regulator
MGATIRLFKIAGIPIYVHTSWFAIYALIVWTLATGYFPGVIPGIDAPTAWALGSIGALLLFVSVLLHELSHSIVAKAHGLTVRGITLHLFGGVSQLENEPRTALAELLIAAVGPLTSFAIAGAIWGLRESGIAEAGPQGAVTAYLVTVNLAVGIFNLLPGFPLDGGRVLRALLWRWTGSLARATYLASRVGIAMAFALIGWGVVQLLGGSVVGGMWLAMIGLFLHQAANAAYAQTAVNEALGALTVRDLMSAEVVTADADETIAELVERLWRHHVSTVPVLERGRFVGIVSVSGLQKLDQSKRATARVRDVMRPAEASLTVGPDESVVVALQRASGNGLGRLAVLDGDRLAGYLSLKDITHMLALRPSNLGGSGRPPRPPDERAVGAAAVALERPRRAA